jgi:hypothetical protein
MLEIYECLQARVREVVEGRPGVDRWGDREREAMGRIGECNKGVKVWLAGVLQGIFGQLDDRLLLLPAHPPRLKYILHRLHLLLLLHNQPAQSKQVLSLI